MYYKVKRKDFLQIESGFYTVDNLAGFDLLITPAALTAAVEYNRRVEKSVGREEERGGVQWVDREWLCVPCGVMLVEDDGYGNVEEEEQRREGLPVGMVVMAIQAQEQSEEEGSTGSKVLLVGQAYQEATRWSR